jgi:hypothetical protein
MIVVEAIKNGDIVYRPKTLVLVEYSIDDNDPNPVLGQFLVSSLELPSNLGIRPSPVTLTNEEMEELVVSGM